jgi:Tfp pilus assembly protein PilP
MRARILLAVLAAAAMCGGALAQPPPQGSPPKEPAATSADTIKSIIEQELEPAPGGYTYRPQGRRDPFVSLRRPVSADEGPKTRPAGLEGLLIQEIALKGIVKQQIGFVALLEGTDRKSYFVKLGQRLFDGSVVAIDASTVTFRQEVTDPLATQKVRDVKKSLYPIEEARQ